MSGPVIRADTSPAEIQRFEAQYGECLSKHGVPVGGHGEKGPGNITANMSPGQASRYRTQIAACASKRPESVYERFERVHPEKYQSHLHAFITCMRKNGQPVIFIAPDGWGVSDANAANGHLDNTAVDRCESKAFGR